MAEVDDNPQKFPVHLQLARITHKPKHNIQGGPLAFNDFGQLCSCLENTSADQLVLLCIPSSIKHLKAEALGDPTLNSQEPPRASPQPLQHKQQQQP